MFVAKREAVLMVPYQSRKALKNLRAGIDKMEGKLTVADKVYRSFRAGRPFKKDRMMMPQDALAEVCEMRDKLRDSMSESGLNPDDSATGIVFWLAIDEPPQVSVVRVGRENEVLDKMCDAKHMAVTIGALFALKDHERGITRRWAHPFLRSHEAMTLLEKALDSQEIQNAAN
jgi:hypothetical protein